MVVRETQMFGALSDKIGLGMDIASAVVGIAGCGVGLLSAAQAAESGGTLAATQAAQQTAAWGKATAASAQLTGAAATGAEAAAGVVVADHQHDADLAAANAADARGKMEMLARDKQMIMEWLERVSELEAESTDITVRTIEGCSQASDIAIAGVRG